MPDVDATLLASAKTVKLADPNLRHCWDLLVQGMELGWFDRQETHDLLAHLRKHMEFGLEELLFAFSGDKLKVSFLDDSALCNPTDFIHELSLLIEQH